MNDNERGSVLTLPLLIGSKSINGMIDFVKIAFNKVTAKALESNKLLDFVLHVPEKTGEVKKRVAEYKDNLKFTLYENNGGILSGSLHKFWQDNTNYRDYSFEELLRTIILIKKLFGIDPLACRLQNVEIGVNLTDLPITPDQFIHSLILHKGILFSTMKNRSRKSIGKDCYHQRYGIKVYNKGKQYKLRLPILRIEIKYTKMIELNQLGIFTLGDLVKSDNHKVLGKLLEKRLEEVLIFEPNLSTKKLTKVERRNIIDYSNPRYWEGLSQQKPKSYQYHRKRYEKVIFKYVNNPLKNIAVETIKQKWNNLTAIETKTLAKLTTDLFQKVSRINHSYSRLNASNNYLESKKCKVTSLDISNQKKGSTFISEKNSSYRFAHWARNCDSNPRNNLRRRILNPHGSAQPTLFDTNEYVRLTDKQKKLLEFWKGTKYEVIINRK